MPLMIDNIHAVSACIMHIVNTNHQCRFSAENELNMASVLCVQDFSSYIYHRMVRFIFPGGPARPTGNS